MTNFILVYNQNNLNEEQSTKLETFQQNLVQLGIELETVEFSGDPNIMFIKIIASDEVIEKYALVCEVYLACKTFEFRAQLEPPPKIMATPLTDPKADDEIYQRAPEYVSGNIPNHVTSAERILVLDNLLMRVRFGDEISDFGYQKLLRDRILLDAFPLHKEFHEWTDSGPLNDRQLLRRYWGNFRSWYKALPLNTIERYFGAEYAFYFAWLEFYTKMLVPIGIGSILTTLYGIITFSTVLNDRSYQICKSEVIMCPRCHYNNCRYEKLSNSCVQSHLTYFLDNPASLVLAIIVSFWSTIFMECWQRKEAVLQLQWNVKDVEHDTSLRYEYIEAADTMKYSKVKDMYLPAVGKKKKALGITISLSTVLLLLLLMVLAVVGVIIYRVSVAFMIIRSYDEQIIQQNYRLIASMTGAMISATFIIIFKMIYTKIAVRLTRMEHHRTEYEFDTAYIYKVYALAFTNNYSPVFYIAFFKHGLVVYKGHKNFFTLKGRLYTHPGDMKLWDESGGIFSDTCDPTGCIFDLGFQLICIMMMKLLVSNIIQVFLPIIVKFVNKRKSNVQRHENLPHYEEEYLMAPTGKFFLVDEYMDMVIQYGFVVFFVAGFPLAPFFALVNNIFEIRVDASKLIKNFRRPIPKKVSGLGAWFSILHFITYLGVVTNAIVIAFVSNAVPGLISGEKYFLNESLSEYAISEFAIVPRAGEKKMEVCLYHGRRYPPDHPKKYDLTSDFWYLLAFRFIIVLAFEHVVVFLNGILAYAIPDVPKQVTEQFARQEKKNKEIRLQALRDQSNPTPGPSSTA